MQPGTDITDALPKLLAWRSYMLHCPIITEVWLIDRPAWLYTIIDALGPSDRPSFLSSIPIIEWHTPALEAHIEQLRREEWDDEKLAEHFPFREPGIWVKMSNGELIHVEERQ